MGGFGSGRRGWGAKKTQVEQCHKLPLSTIKAHLKPGWHGHVTWSRSGEKIASIGYEVWGNNGAPLEVYFIYTITKSDGTKINFRYSVDLTTTPLPWGGVRYWFVCPLEGCGRRVGCLYLPPGGKYFGCRHCYNLTYESQQEGNWSRNFFGRIASEMMGGYPGITWKDVRALWDGKSTKNLSSIYLNKSIGRLLTYDKYEGYLSADELCQQSRLTSENLIKLEDERLLVPDTMDGRYRPKLAGWGKKLAYLLGEGWRIDEIKRWSKERWKSGNPRQWPPERRNVTKDTCI